MDRGIREASFNVSKNAIRLQPGANIGNASAENDSEFLFESFVQNPVMANYADGKVEKNFVIGRTGSGKTAILRMVEKSAASSSELDVYELSMTYVANSDVFAFLDNMGADLSLFFQYLWRHILLSRFIQERFGVDDQTNSFRFFDNITEFFKKETKRSRALKYIEAWRDKLWLDTDEIVREVSSRTEKQIEGEIGGELAKFKARGGINYKISNEKRLEYQRRLRNIINPEQLQDTAKVLDALRAYESGQKYNDVYILIDKIDENWVDESIRFKLIRGLIEAVRVFRTVQNCHVLVSLRTDVYERVIQETSDIGFQRDKYEDYFARIRWRKPELKQIVNNRINILYKRQYTKENVHFEDVFAHNVGQTSPFDYMIQRTLYRPRDIIDFVNACLTKAVGDIIITAKIIREAEGEYSTGRRDALIAEWKAALPSLNLLLGALRRRRPRFLVADLDALTSDEFLLQILSLTRAEHDPIVKIVQEVAGSKNRIDLDSIKWRAVSELYRVGAIGIKTPGSDRYYYSYRDAPVIDPGVIDNDTKIHIHEMLHRVLLVEQNRS